MTSHKLTLSEIWIYPVKSLGGISLTSAKVLPKGLQYDRRWMLVDENNVFMTQRIHTKMALFKLALASDHNIVSFQGDSIKLPINSTSSGSSIEVTIWDDLVQAHEVNERFSKWFSERLGITCKLVFFPENNPRPVEGDYKINDDHTSLSDGFPFLIIGQSSLDDLNSRLEKAVPINRFRPNFVFTGGDPYEEDHWKNFAIGQNRFVRVKPCGRCVLTTVDQDTAEKGIEPLKTLSIYRKQNNKVLFGQNVIALNYNEVSVGDKIVLN